MSFDGWPNLRMQIRLKVCYYEDEALRNTNIFYFKASLAHSKVWRFLPKILAENLMRSIS